MDYFIMAPSHSSYFFIWTCTCFSLVVANVTLNKDAVNTGIPQANYTDKSLNGSENLEDSYNPFLRTVKCDGDDICFEPECVHKATKLLNDMDLNVKPCDDFYKFSCGGFLKSTFLPDHEKESISQCTHQTLLEQLRSLVEKEISPNEPRPYKLVKNFYKACMNETAIKKQNFQILLDHIETLGGWPVLGNYNTSHFNWTNCVSDLRKLGYSNNYFFTFNVKYPYSERYTERNYIFISPPTFGIPADILKQGLKNIEVEEYYKTMVKIAVLFGANRSRAEEEMMESLEFEIMLAKLTLEKHSYDNMGDLDEMYRQFPSMPWKEYLNSIITPISLLLKQRVAVVRPNFLEDFLLWIKMTPKRIQANYAVWRMIYESAELIDVTQKLSLIQRYPQGVPKWMKCTQLVSNHLNFSVSSMYFGEQKRVAAFMMIENIKKTFENMLNQLEWVDEKIREDILSKTARIEEYIMHPDEYLDIKKLDKLYEKLELSPDDPFENKLRINIFETNRLIDKLQKPMLPNERWKPYFNPASPSHKYYNDETDRNIIKISASIIQQAAFDIKVPHYMNYGALGTSYGHIITDFFDYGNILHDDTDYLTDWGTIDCLIQQYTNYVHENFGIYSINGQVALAKNIADIGGLKAAYYAYQRWVKEHEPEQSLPGLPYTPNQMFWISHANLQCTRYRYGWLEDTIPHNPYPPREFRVNGALSNMEEFAKDFNCKEGSKMNPLKKCSLWYIAKKKI